MRHLTGYGLIALLFGVSGSVHAQPGENWVNAFRHDVGMVQVDRSSVRREGGNVTLRSRIVFNAVQGDGTKTAVTHYRFNCSARTAELLVLTRLGSNGRTLSSPPVSAAGRRPQPIGPRSPNAGIFQAACG